MTNREYRLKGPYGVLSFLLRLFCVLCGVIVNSVLKSRFSIISAPGSSWARIWSQLLCCVSFAWEIVRDSPMVNFDSQTMNKDNCLLSSIFSAGEGGFGQMMYRSHEGHLRTPGMEFFCTVPRPHFLGRALIWPGCFGEHILGLFGLYPSSLSKSVGFVCLSGKASLVSIAAAILFLRSWQVYFPLEFEFRGKSCVE